MLPELLVIIATEVRVDWQSEKASVMIQRSVVDSQVPKYSKERPEQTKGANREKRHRATVEKNGKERREIGSWEMEMERTRE